MKTIEIVNKKFQERKYAFPLYRRFTKNETLSHFFFEPNLIIRLSKPKKLIEFLKKYKIKHLVYNYPYPKKPHYGESREFKYILPSMLKLFHIQAKIATSNYSNSNRVFFANRLHHCFLNMRGFSFLDEAFYHFKQGWGYFKHEVRNYFLIR